MMKIALLANCILNQSVRAKGVKNKTGEGPIEEVLDVLNRYDVSIIQMPCTEVAWEGFDRRASGKTRYDNPEYRSICTEAARYSANYVKKLIDDRGGELAIVLGVDGSPSCGVNFCFGRGRRLNEPGIYFEELRKELSRKGLNPTYIGITTYGRGLERTIRRIEDALK